jgi:lambda family phage tail tape measure protein
LSGFGSRGTPKYASPFAGAGDISNLTANALGGIYGSPTRFANGGTFTNSVVTAPTLFRFANGAQLGEMGEAGPEAIMPLKRGPNGALGVQMHGGGSPAIRMGDYSPNFSFEGAVGLDGIASMVRQGGEATYNQMKRDLQTLLQQLDTDGAFAS